MRDSYCDECNEKIKESEIVYCEHCYDKLLIERDELIERIENVINQLEAQIHLRDR